MRRLLLVATACALGLTSASSAKEERWGLRICGASGCRDILQWQNWVDGRATRPASASAYFSISYLDRRGKPVSSDWPSLYYERVRKHWIAVNLWSAQPTPWGDGANFVWISRRGALLRRDGELLRIPPALAERVRRGESLRGV